MKALKITLIFITVIIIMMVGILTWLNLSDKKEFTDLKSSLQEYIVSADYDHAIEVAKKIYSKSKNSEDKRVLRSLLNTQSAAFSYQTGVNDLKEKAYVKALKSLVKIDSKEVELYEKALTKIASAQKGIISDAEQLMDEGQYVQAIASVKELLSYTPNCEEAQVLLKKLNEKGLQVKKTTSSITKKNVETTVASTSFDEATSGTIENIERINESDWQIIKMEMQAHVESLILAINTGHYNYVEDYIMPYSDYETAQRALVKKLYNDDIREEFIALDLIDVQYISEDLYIVSVMERVKVFYPSGKDKTSDFNWDYLVFYRDLKIKIKDIKKPKDESF